MLYALLCEDCENSLPLRRIYRAAHLERLTELKNRGLLVLAGPYPKTDSEDPGEAGFSGSLIVAEFDSQEEARRWIEADPFVKNGVYKTVMVKPFIRALP
jgi:uncharacterized protein YciI